MSDAQVLALKAEIEALPPPDRLRLAAQLLEAGKGRLAHTIAERVVLELGAALALADFAATPTAEGKARDA